MEIQLDLLAFAAHPDDVELNCAGTIIKLADMGYKTGVIALTRGEMSTRGTTQLRQLEFETAARIMGLAIFKCLDLPDTHIAVSQINKLKIIKEIRCYRPRLVFAPYWQDRHPDHCHCSHLVREAAFFAGVKKIVTEQAQFRPSAVIYFSGLIDFSPSFVVDISATHDRKLQAIRAYQSQFHNPTVSDDQDVTFISTPEFLESIITKSRFWGAKIGVRYGEPFLVRSPLNIPDPVALFSAPAKVKNSGYG